MRYVSTRGCAPPANFTDTLLAGLAPDGGLYVPEAWPRLSPEAIAGFAGRPYAEVGARVLKLFAGDTLTAAECQADCVAAYASFTHAAVAPLRQLGDGLWLLELFHGPTLAFKDVAMQLLARLYARELSRTGRRLTIVCATSGDTGGAAVEAFRGSPHVDLVVLFPEGRISEVQRRFMTTTADANVSTVAVEGSFDDCQAMVKALFADAAFREEVDLSGVNSINWARIMAQSVYYLTAGAALGAPARLVSFAVPTGNFGDAFAGYVAQRLGLPVERIVAATNGNDILARTFADGRYARGELRATQSPAMDIQVASNFERLHFEANGRDPEATRRAFESFAQSGELQLAPGPLAEVQRTFAGAAVSEAETTAEMADARLNRGGLIDPHTAVGVRGGRIAYDGAAPLVVLSTAHPAKFPEAVQAATGEAPRLDPRHAHRMTAVERIDRLPADVGPLKAYVRGVRRAAA